MCHFLPFRYDVNLEDAKKVGIKKGLTTGVSMGLIYLFMFSSYALGFWYGGVLVREESETYSVGTVLIVSRYIQHRYNTDCR